MPTYDRRVTDQPQDLVAELSLSEGQYSIQNVDRTAAIWLRESVDPPAARGVGYPPSAERVLGDDCGW